MKDLMKNIQDLLASTVEIVGRSLMCFSQQIKPSSKNSKLKKTRKAKKSK